MRRGAAWYDADTANGTDKPAAVHFTSREERIYSMPLKTRLAPKEHMGLTTRQKIMSRGAMGMDPWSEAIYSRLKSTIDAYEAKIIENRKTIVGADPIVGEYLDKQEE